MKQTTISTVCKNTAYLPNILCKCVDVLTLEVVAFYKINNNNHYSKIELMVLAQNNFRISNNILLNALDAK